MNAYSLVNNQVRRKLDEMLKTWKEPVPGSLDPRPVFPLETIRPIENALIKARTAAIQAQQQQQSRAQQEAMARTRPMATPNPQWRNTPTPPQARGPYYPPPQQMYGPQHVPNGNYQVDYVFSRSPLHAYLLTRQGTTAVSSDRNLPRSSTTNCDDLSSPLPTATSVFPTPAASELLRSHTSRCRETHQRRTVRILEQRQRRLAANTSAGFARSAGCSEVADSHTPGIPSRPK